MTNSEGVLSTLHLPLNNRANLEIEIEIETELIKNSI